MVLGQESSSSRGIVLSFWTCLPLTTFIHFYIPLYTQQGCCAMYIQMPYGSQSVKFWWTSHCSAKCRLMPKISISFSGLPQDIGLCSSGVFPPPLLFLLLVNCIFSPVVFFQSESPSLTMCFFTFVMP